MKKVLSYTLLSAFLSCASVPSYSNTENLSSEIISEEIAENLITEFDNISVGYINYVFDTGVDTSSFDSLLHNPNIKNWSGPYLTIKDNKQSLFGYYSLAKGTDKTNTSPNLNNCTASDICYIWLKLSGVPSKVAEKMDAKLDGAYSATPDSGNFRYQETHEGMVVAYKTSRCQKSLCS